jgi:hypothetical protein
MASLGGQLQRKGINMTEFAYCDTKRPDGVYVKFERSIAEDRTYGRPDENDDGFWPSESPNAAGYVEPDRFAAEMVKAESRMRAWERGDWGYVGVRAKAIIEVVQSGTTTTYELASPGLWGVESDSDEEHLKSVFEDECEILKKDLAMIGAHFKPKIWKWFIVEYSGSDEEGKSDPFETMEEAVDAMHSSYTDDEIQEWPIRIAVDRGDGVLMYDF